MKVLIAEDDAVSRRILEAFLGKLGYEVVVTTNGAEALERLRQPAAPRVAILDWMMPGTDGLEVCRQIRKRGPESYVYVLLVTSKAQRQDIVEGLEGGADDYLTKPYNIHELKARLRAGLRIVELQTQLLEARDGFQFQATHDSLTGLMNRQGILERLDKELARAARQQSPVSIAMADLDHFKKINDTHGHLAGDAVLREAASRMRASVRVYDHIGRYGGEEFLVVLPGCPEEGAVQQGERLRACVSASPIVTPEGPVRVTLSLGVASAGPDQTQMELLQAADDALYRAKRNGRDRIETAAFSRSPGD